MSIQKDFESIGGAFLTDAAGIADKLKSIKAFIFDWDGVFNNGFKTINEGSRFSEVDSMGTNMLRFHYWNLQKELPKCFIITGANNKTAIGLAKREHFDAVFINAKNKKEILDRIVENYAISFDEMLFVYDDILDISAVKHCKLAFFVKRNANIMFNRFVIENKYCDYITGNSGEQHAVREICELLMALYGEYNTTIEKRIAYGNVYQTYLKERNAIVSDINDLKA